jgi:limonene-1,2-epoxide hydrolase
VGHFSVERLTQFKRDHEQRIRFLTDIGGDKTATIIRVVGAIRGSQPELTYDTVLGATTAAGYFPKMLPNAIRAEYEADLRAIADPGAPGYFAVCTRQIAVLMERVNDGIRHDEVQRLAVFGFARIPVLVYLGSRLDDMVPTLVFQRQRTDGECAWSWPAANEPAQFVIEVAKRGKDPSRVSLVVCLSGTVNLEELPSEHQAADTIYVLKPVPPASPGPSIVSSPDILTNFEVVLRQFMAALEAEHGQARHVSLFPAAPVSAAITLGRVLMPGVSPAWNVFDRRDDGEFFEALEVRA